MKLGMYMLFNERNILVNNVVSADHNSFTYLVQRLSVAVQRGNAASVMGSARSLESQDFF